MRLLSHALAAAALAGALLPEPAFAQSDSATGLSLYAETRMVSRYMWRGYDLSQGKVAIQPWVEGRLPNGLGFNAFATTALDSPVQLDEAQLGLTYSRELGGDFEIGAVGLLYIMPGTQTEPSADDGQGGTTTSPEFGIVLTRNFESGFVSLTYSRGFGDGEGNSLNLWAQRTFTWGDERWTAEPYFQVDYLDQYEAPSDLGERMSNVEVGLPVYYSLGSLSLFAQIQLNWIPSRYVREEGGTGRVVPVFGFGLAYERD